MKTTIVAACLGAALVTGCASHKIHYRNSAASGGGQVHSEKQSFFLWGLAGGSEIDLERLCPTGVARIDSSRSGVDAVMTWFTGGLYSPMSVEVECASGSAYQLDLDERGVRVSEVSR